MIRVAIDDVLNVGGDPVVVKGIVEQADPKTTDLYIGPEQDDTEMAVDYLRY